MLRGGGQIFLCEGWSEFIFFFLSVCFLPSFEKAEGYSQSVEKAEGYSQGLFPLLIDRMGNCLVYSVDQCTMAMFTHK